MADADLVVHVVDGAHPDPEEQVRAVREVLAEVGADAVPELLVVNKIDAADEETLLRLKRAWPEAVFVSARSGAGHRRPARHHRGAAAAAGGRGAGRASRTSRGDLVARVHQRGKVLSTAHTADGTLAACTGRRGARGRVGTVRGRCLITDG